MIKIVYLKGDFDPITTEQIEYAKKLIKSGVCREVCFVVGKQGIASYQDRVNMVKAALRPYRRLKLHAKSEIIADQCVLEAPYDSECKARSGYFNRVPKSVNRYLVEHALYLDQIVDAWCFPRRAAHVRSMTKMAVYLAHHHHVDERKALQAGMLHDLCKNMDAAEARRIMEAYYPHAIGLSEKIWHQFTAEYVLKHIMGVRDKAIINAVAHHVMGDHPSALSRIVYIADKIDPGRGYNIDEELSVAERSLKEGAEFVRQRQLEYLKGEIA